MERGESKIAYKGRNRVRGKRKAVTKLPGKKGRGGDEWCKLRLARQIVATTAEEVAARKENKKERDKRRREEREAASRAAKENSRKHREDSHVLAMWRKDMVRNSSSAPTHPPPMRKKGPCPQCSDGATGAARSELEERAGVLDPQEILLLCEGKSARRQRRSECRLQIKTLITETRDTFSCSTSFNQARGQKPAGV
jgi:hypothetical protein